MIRSIEASVIGKKNGQKRGTTWPMVLGEARAQQSKVAQREWRGPALIQGSCPDSGPSRGHPGQDYKPYKLSPSKPFTNPLPP